MKFTYNRDSKRVKSEAYESPWQAQGKRKMKSAALLLLRWRASRIAMRKYTIPVSMSVEYFLGDHLGSTSLTTDTAGNKISEMRYKPWGEVRYAWKNSDPEIIPSAYALTRQTFTDLIVRRRPIHCGGGGFWVNVLSVTFL